jgi:PAS domain-containing protein
MGSVSFSSGLPFAPSAPVVSGINYEGSETMILPGQSPLADIRQLFEQIPSLFIGLGGDRCILLWNAQAEQILGCRAVDVLGCPLEKCSIPWETGRVATGLDDCW